MLKKNQKKLLRTLAHDRSVIIWIGPQGLTDNVMAEIQTALDHHELIKISVRTGAREQRDEVMQRICELTQAQQVQKIGNTLTIFKRNPKQPKVSLSGESS